MPVETGLQVTGQGGGYVSSAPKVASVTNSSKQPTAIGPATTSPPDAAQAKAAQAQQAVDEVKQANANWQGLRKSMAAMRLQRLVNIIKVLALYGGDPKQVARQAADLARELKATVKEFSAAGGDPSTVPGATVDPTAGLVGADGTGSGTTLSAALTSITSSLGTTSAPTPTSAASGFVFQASSLLSQLRTVVASSHRAKSPTAKDQAQHQFDAVAGRAADAIDQAKNSVNILT